MIKRPTDLWPRRIVDEFRRVAEIPGWYSVSWGAGRHYLITTHVRTLLNESISRGADAVNTIACATWCLRPVIARLSSERFAALSQVDIDLPYADFRMPYPSVCVEQPPETGYRCTILHWTPEFLFAANLTPDNRQDTATIFARDCPSLEEVVLKHESDVTEATCTVLRAALNYMLVMTSFGCAREDLFPKEVAKARLRNQPTRHMPILVSLEHDIVLHATEHREASDNHSDVEVSTHWRRGHWARQPYGPGHRLRKVIFRKPVLVRADLADDAPAPRYR